MADVETVYDPKRGVFNHLYATATPLVHEVPESGEPPVKQPQEQSFVVQNFFCGLQATRFGAQFLGKEF